MPTPASRPALPGRHPSPRRPRALAFALLLLGLIGTPGSARLAAELLAHEPFDYPAGANLIGRSGGSGWASAWTGTGGASVTISSTPAAYSLGTATYGGGNSLRVSGGNTVAAATRQIASTAFSAGGGDIYVSFVFRVTGGTGALAPNRFASWSSLDDAFSATSDNTAVLNLSGKTGARVNNQTQLVDHALVYQNDVTQLAAFTPGSPLAWMIGGVYPAPAPGFYGLLARQEQLASAPAPAPARHGLFTRSRLFTWRENLAANGSALWVRGGDPLDYHTHYDRGHVSFTVAGTPVLIEAGTPGYAAANKVADYDSAFGHNVLRINGDAYPLRTAAPVVADVVSDQGGGVSLDLAGVYPALQSYTREVRWTRTMVEIIDRFAAPSATTVTAAMSLHLATAPFASSAIEQISDREYLVIIPAGTIQWGAAPAAGDFASRAMRIRVIGNQPITVTPGSRPDHTLRFRKAANPHGTLEISTVAPVAAFSLSTIVSAP